MHHPSRARMHRRGRINRRGEEKEREMHSRFKDTIHQSGENDLQCVCVCVCVMTDGCGEVVCHQSKRAQYGFLWQSVEGWMHPRDKTHWGWSLSHTHKHTLCECMLGVRWGSDRQRRCDKATEEQLKREKQGEGWESDGRITSSTDFTVSLFFNVIFIQTHLHLMCWEWKVKMLITNRRRAKNKIEKFCGWTAIICAITLDSHLAPSHRQSYSGERDIWADFTP